MLTFNVHETFSTSDNATKSLRKRQRSKKNHPANQVEKGGKKERSHTEKNELDANAWHVQQNYIHTIVCCVYVFE